MSPGRLLAPLGALALLAGLPACPTSSDCLAGEAFPPSLPELLLAGVPAELSVNAVPFGCAPDGTVPASLTVELSGPDNLPVPAQKSFNPATPHLGAVRFTPERAGRYHLFAAFDPVGGIIQADLQVAQDRSSETAPLTLPLECDTLERTARGTWLCGSRVLRGGITERDFPASRLAVAGDVVWRVASGQIERYEDTGTALVLTGSWPHAEGPAESVLATPDTLVVLHGQTVQHAAFDGTALTGGGPTRWTSGPVFSPGLGPRAVLLRAGDTLAVASPRAFSTSSPFTNEACPYTLVKGRLERTAAACSGFNGNVVGFEPGGLWVEEFSNGQMLSFHEWTPQGLVQRGAMRLNGIQLVYLTSPAQNTAPPVLTSHQGFPASTGRTSRPPHALRPVYDAAQRSLRMEYLDSGMLLPRSSSTWMWGKSLVLSPGTPAPGLRVIALPPQ
jgi:hypothetical protein